MGKPGLQEQLGFQVPIFAFSHCRDVVVEVTRAGGFGVLGAIYHSAEQLEQELAWIDRHVDGRAYGVDVLMTSNYDRSAETHAGPLIEAVPEQHKAFLTGVVDELGVPRLAPELEQELLAAREERDRNNTGAGARRLIEVALRHPQVKLIVSALGVPPRDLVDALHERGLLVGALVGKPEHARHHRDAGVDVVIAQGTEAAGHTGTISTMVLVPQVVDALAGSGIAVLAAGGLTSGRHIAAAQALGAAGVWIGSLWLGTAESELLPHEKAALFAASSSDTVRSKAMSGKPARMLSSPYAKAWERPDAPPFLHAPWQGVLFRWIHDRINRAARPDLVTQPVGQGIGVINREERTRDVMYRLIEEYLATLGQLRETLDQLAS